MGKVRNKSHRRDEDLKGELRRLRKKLKQSQKLKHEYEDKMLEPTPEELGPQEEVESVALCPECHKGHLNLLLSLDHKDYFQCNSCEFKKSVKK